MTSAPPNCSDGGVWGTYTYVGNKTKMIAGLSCLCCGPFALLVCCCPQDEQDAYCTNYYLYDAAGNNLGPTKASNFIPSGAKRPTKAPFLFLP
mmetsp:Transcript_7681/g.11260  ORF Transcript_7681/g.11260 Transcript_7681/m.11260 type:complete len:93 (-) Transcript_7681:184-462(-)